MNCKDHNFTSCQKISLLNESCKSRFFHKNPADVEAPGKKILQNLVPFPGEKKKSHFQNDAMLGTLEMYPLNPILSYFYF